MPTPDDRELRAAATAALNKIYLVPSARAWLVEVRAEPSSTQRVVLAGGWDDLAGGASAATIAVATGLDYTWVSAQDLQLDDDVAAGLVIPAGEELLAGALVDDDEIHMWDAETFEPPTYSPGPVPDPPPPAPPQEPEPPAAPYPVATLP